MAASPLSVDARERDLYGRVRLHWLVRQHTATEDAVSSQLQAYPAAISLADARGLLPLHHALRCRASESVLNMLLDCFEGAARAKDTHDRFALHYAVGFASSDADDAVSLRVGSLVRASPAASIDGGPILDDDGLLAESLMGGPVGVVIDVAAPEDSRDCVLVAVSLPVGVIRGWYRRSALQPAALQPAPESVIRRLLALHPAAAAALDEHGRSPLHYACGTGAEPWLVEALVAATVSPASSVSPAVCLLRDCQGRTPLHWAALAGSGAATLEPLLSAAPSGSAAAMLRDKHEQTPLAAACRSVASGRSLTDEAVLALLAAAPAAAAEVDLYEATPLHLLAGAWASPVAMRALLEAPGGAEAVRSCDYAGRVPLARLGCLAAPGAAQVRSVPRVGASTCASCRLPFPPSTRHSSPRGPRPLPRPALTAASCPSTASWPPARPSRPSQRCSRRTRRRRATAPTRTSSCRCTWLQGEQAQACPETATAALRPRLRRRRRRRGPPVARLSSTPACSKHCSVRGGGRAAIGKCLAYHRPSSLFCRRYTAAHPGGARERDYQGRTPLHRLAMCATAPAALLSRLLQVSDGGEETRRGAVAPPPGVLREKKGRHCGGELEASQFPPRETAACSVLLI